MHTSHKQAELSFTSAELLRIKQWYQAYVGDKSVVLLDADLILDAKFRAARYEMVDRDTESIYAVRSNVAKQYVGPERRARMPVRARIKRPAVMLELTH